MHRRELLIRVAVASAAVSINGLAGCAALPRSGPTTAQMRGDEDPDALEGLVAPLTPATLAAIPAPPQIGFPAAFLEAAPIDTTLIGVDDQLDVTVWESEGAGLFQQAGGATTIASATVDPDGRVFVPFAGFQFAAGSTVRDLRARIRGALEEMTLAPQVDVRLRAPRSRMVAVQGAVGAPGLYPIERPTARLGAMLAQAGGAATQPERSEALVRRGALVGREVLADILTDPALDIALRPGDQILISEIRERFLVLGAASIQAELSFSSRPLNLLSALGAARGLRDFDADPTGVFVFRREPEAVAAAILRGPRPDGLPEGPGRPIVYRLDMTDPQGLFVARQFQMRDGDAIFATNAPLTELRKFLQIFTSVLTPVQQTTTLGGSL